MTNTHINVGGHKVTTNKVGTAKAGTLETGFTGNLYYVVSNNICFVFAHPLTVANTGIAQIICKNLPKGVKLASGINYAGIPCIGGSSVTAANHLVGNLYMSPNVNGYAVLQGHFIATGNCYVSFSYPVADDWVES